MQLVVERTVLDRQQRLVGDAEQHPHVARRQRPSPRAALHDHRAAVGGSLADRHHREGGARRSRVEAAGQRRRLLDRDGRDPARVEGRTQHPAGRQPQPHQPPLLARGQAQRGSRHQLLAVARPHRDGRAVDQPVDRGRQHRGDAVDACLQRQRGAQLEQRLRHLHRLGLAAVQPHPLAGGGGLGGDHLEQAQIVVVEPGQPLLAEHDHAHRAAIGRHRRHQHRLVDRIGAGDLDRVGHIVGVVDALGAALGKDGAGDSLADLADQVLGVLVLVQLADAVERDRLERPPVLGNHVEPARVVIDQRAQLADHDLADLGHRVDGAERPRQRQQQLHLVERTIAAAALGVGCPRSVGRGRQ